MRIPQRNFSPSAFLIVVSLLVFGWAVTTGNFSVSAEQQKAADSDPRPVDDDMHHFMEYVFAPSYERLKSEMADTPQDKKAWKAIKGESLTLAECANLLLLRAPDDNTDEWRNLSIAVRAQGAELYQAARQADYPAAQQAYVRMLKKCNACHNQFADGEHQLLP